MQKKEKSSHSSFANYTFVDLLEKVPHVSVKTFLGYIWELFQN